MTEENKELKPENKDTAKPPVAAKPETPKPEAPKAEEPKAEAPKAEAPKSEEPKAEAPKPEEPKAAAAKPEEKKKEKPSNCAGCKKSIKKKRYYYRNGNYYCTQRCFRATVKKASQEAKDKPAEAGAK